MDPPRRKKKGTAAKKKKKAGPDVVLIAKLLHTVDAKTIDKVLRSSGGSAQTAIETIYTAMDDYMSPALEDALPEDGIRLGCGNCASTYVTMSGNPLCLNCRKKRYECTGCGAAYLSFNHSAGKPRTCLDCFFAAQASQPVAEAAPSRARRQRGAATDRLTEAEAAETSKGAATGVAPPAGTDGGALPPAGVDPEDPDWLTWEAFDTDGSGRLTISELHELFTEAGLILSAAQVARVNAFADADGSGSVCFAEFKELLLKVRTDGVESLLVRGSSQQWGLGQEQGAQPSSGTAAAVPVPDGQQPASRPAEAAATVAAVTEQQQQPPPQPPQPPPPPQPQQQQQQQQQQEEQQQEQQEQQPPPPPPPPQQQQQQQQQQQLQQQPQPPPLPAPSSSLGEGTGIPLYRVNDGQALKSDPEAAASAKASPVVVFDPNVVHYALF